MFETVVEPVKAQHEGRAGTWWVQTGSTCILQIHFLGWVKWQWRSTCFFFVSEVHGLHLLMINVSVVSDYIWMSYYIIIINCSKPGNSFLALNSIWKQEIGDQSLSKHLTTKHNAEYPLEAWICKLSNVFIHLMFTLADVLQTHYVQCTNVIISHQTLHKKIW